MRRVNVTGGGPNHVMFAVPVRGNNFTLHAEAVDKCSSRRGSESLAERCGSCASICHQRQREGELGGNLTMCRLGGGLDLQKHATSCTCGMVRCHQILPEAGRLEWLEWWWTLTRSTSADWRDAQRHSAVGRVGTPTSSRGRCVDCGAQRQATCLACLIRHQNEGDGSDARHVAALGRKAIIKYPCRKVK